MTNKQKNQKTIMAVGTVVRALAVAFFTGGKE